VERINAGMRRFARHVLTTKTSVRFAARLLLRYSELQTRAVVDHASPEALCPTEDAHLYLERTREYEVS
jgi:hypothetical protein